MKPYTDKVKAITKMPSPTSVTELKQVLGQLCRKVPARPLFKKLHPITALLRKESKWVWSDAQEASFEKVKAMLVSVSALAYYDINRKTVIIIMD